MLSFLSIQNFSFLKINIHSFILDQFLNGTKIDEDIMPKRPPVFITVSLNTD